MRGKSRLTSALVVCLIAGCTGGLGTTSTSILRKVQTSPDPNLRYKAYAKLASPRVYDNEQQKVDAVAALAKALEADKEPVVSRAVICRTLGELHRPEARPSLVQALNDPEPAVRASACRSLGEVGAAEDAVELARVMVADNDHDCRLAAIAAIGALKPADPRMLTVLADGMENKDPAVRLASYQALRSINGQDLGPEVKAWRDLADAKSRAAEPKTTDPTVRR